VTRTALLVVGPSWVGDMVMAQSLFRLLKQRQPEQAIDVLAPKWSLPLISRMPEIRRGIPLPFAHGELAFSRRWQLGQWLRASAYRQAIILPRSMKAALVPWFAGIRRRTGYRGEMRFRVINDMRRLDKSVLDQTVKRFVALGLGRNEPLPAIPQPQLEVSGERQQSLCSQLQLETDRPVVAFMPGAEYGPAKCWPLEYFASLARKLDELGYQVWIFGSDSDLGAGEFIAAHSAARNLCGQTRLADAVDLLALCEQAVSNDSGLMHVAAATGIRVHAIYGSSTPQYTPPLTELRQVHYLALSCSPCFARECPLGHLRCLKEISVERVLTGISGEFVQKAQEIVSK
jgi:heptosyltransferase-2